MEELIGGYRSDSPMEEYKQKINEMVGWINAHEAKEREENREPERDERTEEILKRVRECLMAYGDREECLKGCRFNYYFHGLHSSVEVRTWSYRNDPKDFDVVVEVRNHR